MYRIFGPEWKKSLVHQHAQHATSACGMRIISIHPYNPPQPLKKAKRWQTQRDLGHTLHQPEKNTCLVNRQRLEGGLGAGSSRVSQVWGQKGANWRMAGFGGM